MLDHLTIHVSNLEASKAWYGAALKPLGVRIIKEVGGGLDGGVGDMGSLRARFACAWPIGAGLCCVALALQRINAVKTRSFADTPADTACDHPAISRILMSPAIQ